MASGVFIYVDVMRSIFSFWVDDHVCNRLTSVLEVLSVEVCSGPDRRYPSLYATAVGPSPRMASSSTVSLK